MKNRLFRLTGFLFFILLSACVSTPALQTQFEDALDQGQLKTAGTRLEKLEARVDHEQYRLYQEQWQEALQQEAGKIHTDTEKLLSRQQWSEALQNLQQEKSRIGEQERLLQIEQRIHQHELTTLSKPHQEWMMARATTLAQQGARLQVADQGNSEDAQRMRQWKDQEIPTIIAFLKAQSDLAAARKQWQSVLDMQQMLARISPTDSDTSLLRQAQQQLGSARERASTQRAQQQKQQLDTLFTSFREQRTAKNLASLKSFAQTHAQTLDAQSVSRVQREVDTFITEKTQQGDRAYAENNFRQARSHWREARRLAPDSEVLNQKLARVERVLSSLRALEN